MAADTIMLKIKAEDAQKIADYLSTRPWREAHPFMVMLNTLEPVDPKQLAGVKPGEAKPVTKAPVKAPALKTVPKAAEANGAEEPAAEEAAEAAE